ncbi:MAG: (2E,6E)-farnesyl diphosphate synthase [Gammaproteobacteria bacterium]|nr:(2E,6E)-farnesyl diphosphate synthase [Gammaproteobacteria bacterium]
MSNNSISLKKLLRTYADRVEGTLDKWLPQAKIQPSRLHEAMRYATLSGGKRIRPVLVYATGAALGVPLDLLDRPACAVELIHAYSLVHDDLPAMDDDDLRRGIPTCHRAFEEGTALLVGDALQSLAFYVLSHGTTRESDQERRLEMIETLALAAGSRGMAGGQAIDLASVGVSLNITELENMHIHKTGALIRASVKLGALATDLPDRGSLEKLDHYAKCIGLAFQIRDDILDVESDTDILGKTQGADAAHNKPTYPAIVGLAEAKIIAAELHAQSLASLDNFDAKADPLRWISDYIVQRER